jgi:hypothetical protein
MFFGTNAGKFYSAIGWGNSALVAGMFSYWVLAVSIIIIKNKKTIHKSTGISKNLIKL